VGLGNDVTKLELPKGARVHGNRWPHQCAMVAIVTDTEVRIKPSRRGLGSCDRRIVIG
jgi:hypothetical protein